MVAVAATTTTKTTVVEALRVAVIGGGAAGLSAARILSRNGIEPVVFEKDSEVGGVWNYEESTQQKAKPMYRGLRTNLPREVMRYREQPWGTRGPPTDDGLPSYVTHKDVLQYLKDFRQKFNLDQYIRYGTQVTNLKVLKDEKSQVQLTTNEELPMFELEWQQQQHDPQCQTFDAVCVANGHYAKPAFAHVEGMKEHFKGNVLHSIEYDDPTLYKGKTVLCIGGRASGSDLAREISHHATKVYLSDTTCKTAESWQNVHWVPTTQRVNSDGSIEFGCSGDDAVQDIDTIIFCTGYDYEFPFISSTSNLELSFLPGERRVKPLYKQFWHAQYPNLAFIGLPHSVVPFPLFELQMEAFVYQLLLANNSSNDNSPSKVLPALEQRVKEAMVDAESGGPKPAGSGRLQDTHFLGSYQWDYCREMADWANNLTPEVERYISTNKAIYDHAGSERKGLFPGGPDTYRSTCYSRLNTGDDDKDGYFEVTSTKMTSGTTEEVETATAAASS